MKKNKILIILSLVLVVLLATIGLLIINLNKKQSFRPPKFDSNVSKIPTNIDYQSQLLEVGEGYSIYISANPKVVKNNLIVDFVSLDSNNIWIKIRVLHKDVIIAESGLVKPGEYLKKIKLDKKISDEDNITYVIMGYEPDTYLSAGTINLNTRVDK